MTELTKRDRLRLVGVAPKLIRVVELARTRTDFIVTEGLRTRKRQEELLAAGASRTMNSKHLVGRAVDLAVLVGAEVRWDWPLYEKLGAVMKLAAQELGISIVWGGDWKSFRDGPHFELAEKE